MHPEKQSGREAIIRSCVKYLKKLSHGFWGHVQTARLTFEAVYSAEFPKAKHLLLLRQTPNIFRPSMKDLNNLLPFEVETMEGPVTGLICLNPMLVERHGIN